MTFAILRESGNIPVARDWFMISVNGLIIAGAKVLIFFRDMPSCPAEYFVFRELIIVVTEVKGLHNSHCQICIERFFIDINLVSEFRANVDEKWVECFSNRCFVCCDIAVNWDLFNFIFLVIWFVQYSWNILPFYAIFILFKQIGMIFPNSRIRHT